MPHPTESALESSALFMQLQTAAAHGYAPSKSHAQPTQNVPQNHDKTVDERKMKAAGDCGDYEVSGMWTPSAMLVVPESLQPRQPGRARSLAYSTVRR